jgi:hypothetical protein
MPPARPIDRFPTRFNRQIFFALSFVPMLLAAPQTSLAQGVIGVHTISRHDPPRRDHQEQNWGLYYRTAGGIEFGGYRNTLDRASFYVTQTWRWHWLSASLGLLTGYDKREEKVDCEDGSPGPCYETRGNTSGKVGPLAALSVTAPPLWGVSPRLTILPGFLVNSMTVYHLSFEHPL